MGFTTSAPLPLRMGVHAVCKELISVPAWLIGISKSLIMISMSRTVPGRSRVGSRPGPGQEAHAHRVWKPRWPGQDGPAPGPAEIPDRAHGVPNPGQESPKTSPGGTVPLPSSHPSPFAPSHHTPFPLSCTTTPSTPLPPHLVHHHPDPSLHHHLPPSPQSQSGIPPECMSECFQQVRMSIQ